MIDHTIQIVRIPLEVDNRQIRGIFSQLSPYHTRVRGLYQVAFITYEGVKNTEEIYDKTWSVYIGIS